MQQAWRDEIRSARAYHDMAARETDAAKRDILKRMAEAEERHAETWAQRLRDLGAAPGAFAESLPERLRRWLLVRSDSATAAKMLQEGEKEAEGLYAVLLRSAPAESDRITIREAQRDERAHAMLLGDLEGPSALPQSRLNRILGRERWHVRAGGWIGQAIYGVNDGLGAAFGVVSGVAGATSANGEFVLLSGAAAMIASALSMGSGAYLAQKAEREVYEAEMEREKREIESNPAEEREELELFYQLKGFSEDEARSMAARLAERPDHLLQTLAHEELGLSEQTFPNEWRAALSATLSTAIGASIPVLPFLFTQGVEALILSFLISTIAHFVVGASKVIVTGRSWLKSGLEMTLIGIGEAGVTYLLGVLVAPLLG